MLRVRPSLVSNLTRRNAKKRTVAVKTRTTVDPFANSASRQAAGVFGMSLFLMTLGVLFAATMLGYVVVRLNPDPQAPFFSSTSPALPHLMLVSTLTLLISSVTIHATVKAVRAGSMVVARSRAGITLGLAMVFLLLQGVSWFMLWQQKFFIGSSMYAWTFYVLTGLHALHVVGGLVPLTLVWRRVRWGRYQPKNPEGLLYCEMYWHFLGGVWLALYATLWLGSLTWR